MRLARYFGTSAAIWLRLQVRYDLEVAQARLAKSINRYSFHHPLVSCDLKRDR